MGIAGIQPLWPGEARKPVHAGDQDVLHTAVFQAIHDGQAEFSTFIFANIHPQHVLLPIHVYA